jgi:hypothetical protein
MKTKIISIWILLILLIPTFASTSYASTCNFGPTNNNSPNETVEVVKTIKNGTSWVTELETAVGSIVRFKIKVTYHDTDGDGIGFLIKDIVITDSLPEGLEYYGNATKLEDDISEDGKNITWNLNKNLEDNESYSLQFDARAIGSGEQVNNVNVSAIETCYQEQRWGEAQATVIGITGIDAVYKDVDDDQIDEIAINENNDSSDGYEKYKDPNNNSEAVLSIDGDNDGKIDHFVDIDEDEVPDRYWDPDNDTLSVVWPIDVDYDGTIEWVYDSDGDEQPDKYYDPDDGQIYPYIVYGFTIGITGNGEVLKDPDGILYLEGFEVELTAIADEGWKFVSYSGDVESDEATVSVVMDNNKEIDVLFEEDTGNPPTVEITKPEENTKYLFNIKIKNLDGKTEIVGPIKIEANAESDVGIEKVEFYINDELEKTDEAEPYNYWWLWKPLEINKEYTIKAIAYDTEGRTSTDSIDVIRSRFRPILDHKLFWGGLLVSLGALYLLKNKEPEPEDETKPDDEIPDVENNPPAANAGGPYSGVVGKSIKFDGSKSYDSDGDELDFYWEFGDGSTGAGEIPPHTYNKAGEFTVTLTVTDSQGATDADTARVVITDDDAEEDEGDLFWYIVGGLCIVLLSLLGLIYFRRRTYV